MIGRPPRSPLFPYTTLSRSSDQRPFWMNGVGSHQDGDEARRSRFELLVRAEQPAPRRSRKQPTQVRQHPWIERGDEDRKSTRLNSSHSQISYAVFCLKKKIN